MRLATIILVATFCLCGCATRPVSRAAIRAPYLADVSTWLVKSAQSKRTYQISVALPNGYATNHESYPVLFAADANGEFGMLVETARLLSWSEEIPDLVIVGIGYANPGQGFKASFAPRSMDLTPTASPGMLAFLQDFAKNVNDPAPEAIGGAPGFLNFIRMELVPSIQKKYNVSHEDRAWFGHSLGGLFGVYAMLNNDGLFRRFLIGSPSLWWDNKVMFNSEESYHASHKSLPARVYFAVGAEEDSMVSDLQNFAAQVKAHDYQGLEFDTQVFEGETHMSVIPTTISRGLRYLYPSPAKDAAEKH